MKAGSIIRRATEARGSRRGEMPITTSDRSRSGQRAANWSAVAAPIENPSRWNVGSPSASAKASRSSTSQS